MDIDEYYRSLHAEFIALRNRVRYMIGKKHWPTDGGWKESVLRAALRRALGASVEVGQGFFVEGDRLSRQCDVLIWSSDAPVLFRDGNLAIIPARSVRAVVEVKTSLDPTTLNMAMANLKQSAQVLPTREGLLLGIFAYDTGYTSSTPILEALRERNVEEKEVIDLICHGPDRFIQYWQWSPKPPKRLYERWHSYHMAERSFAYFVANVVSHLAPKEYSQEGPPFFPRDGKEPYRDGDILRAGGNVERSSEFFGTSDQV